MVNASLNRHYSGGCNRKEAQFSPFEQILLLKQLYKPQGDYCERWVRAWKRQKLIWKWEHHETILIFVQLISFRLPGVKVRPGPSCSRILGIDFFIPFTFPNFGNGFFSFPSRSWILGIDFFIPFLFPKFGNVFFHSLPVPELREWVFSMPFPFPNFGIGIIHSRSRSRTPKCHSRSPQMRAECFCQSNY